MRWSVCSYIWNSWSFESCFKTKAEFCGFKVHWFILRQLPQYFYTLKIISPKTVFDSREKGGVALQRICKATYKKQHKYVFVRLLLFAVCFIFLSMNMFVSYCVWLRFREIHSILDKGMGVCCVFNVYFYIFTNLHITSCVSSTRHISGFLSCPS